MDGVEALLFDLGGVVIDIDFDRVFAHWAAAAGTRLETIRARFAFDTFYARHERGEIEASAYFAALRRSLGLNLSDAQFVAGWSDLYVGETPGVGALLYRLQDRIPLYAFTNSNPTHQRVWAKNYATILRCFRHVFVSSDLGMRKPEPEAFAAIADAIGVRLPRILFFDDTLENVLSARAIGMPAVHVRSLHDIEQAVAGFLV
jgi:putative hydrolase of the HAD superfamily